jgi:hypothetical protein
MDAMLAAFRRWSTRCRGLLGAARRQMADFERIRLSPAHVYTAILAHLVSFNDLSSNRSVTVPAKGTSHSSPAASESAENK